MTALDRTPSFAESRSPDPVPEFSSARISDGLRCQMLMECDAMLRFALANGLKMAPSLLDSLTILEKPEEQTIDGSKPDASPPLAEIAALHGQLADIVAPAKPYTLFLLHHDRAQGRWYSLMGPLPNIRRLMLTAVSFLLLFLGTCLSPTLNPQTIADSIYTLDGWPLLVLLLFLISAAGLGACFNVLFTATQCVRDGNYDPQHEATYWLQIAMGIMAGLFLSELLDNNATEQTQNISKPVLALLGGFSASLLHRILTKLVDTIDSVFRSDKAAGVSDTTNTRMNQIALTEAQARIEVASQLVTVRDALMRGTSPETVANDVSRMLKDLVPANGVRSRSAASACAPDTTPAASPAVPASSAPALAGTQDGVPDGGTAVVIADAIPAPAFAPAPPASETGSSAPGAQTDMPARPVSGDATPGDATAPERP